MKMRLLLVLCLCINTGLAKDLGVHGSLYPIAEENVLDVIAQRLDVMQENGEIEKLQEKMKQKTQASVARPKSVFGIQKTTQAKTYLFDPSVMLEEDIRDANGRLIHARGTKINPLGMINFSKTLIFIDGDDNKQVKWALEQYADNVKIVLVGGNILDLMKAHEKPLFFDQGGALTKRLNIKFVPSRLRVEGDKAFIDEVML